MKNLSVLCLSDIHFEKNSPENQGLVLNEFFKDLPNVIGTTDKDNLYCIISGDLVQAGNLAKSYEDFSKSFLKKLQQYIPLDHIIVVAGNHDLNRNILSQNTWRAKQDEYVASQEAESKYNESLKTQEESLIEKKFQNFNQFVYKELQLANYNMFGYEVNIVPEISVYCLNTALLSNGGLEGLPDDMGKLRIETSGLYKWAQENEGRTKILVMHHPSHHLTEYAQAVLDNNIRKYVNVVITGHLHRQDFKQYLGKEKETVKYCSSPQLFSDKRDQNGYSCIQFVDSNVDSVVYRKWSTVREEFVAGTEFTDTPDGMITFKRTVLDQDDYITKELTSELSKSLRAYNYIPTWVDRMVSNIAPGASMKQDEVIQWDHIDIINSEKNIQIVGGAQFGLTCFGHKLVLEAWNIKKEHWLYVRGKDLRLSRLQNQLDDFLADRSINANEVKTIVIDDWNKAYDDRQKLRDKIHNFNPNIRLVLLNNEDDTVYFAGLNNNQYEEDFQLLYLRELSRRGVRLLSKEFIEKCNLNVDESSKILERLITQLLELNVHRTPINCLQLMLNFQQNYDARPMDRTKILKSLIMFFFLKPDSYFYTDSIDETDCCTIMGRLCEELMRSTDGKHYRRYFSEEEFVKATASLEDRYPKTMRLKLLRAMQEAQIIVPYLNLYEFRFSYWVYFFAAYQMYIDKDFYDYMLVSAKCIYMPDIVEFYSGIDPKCDDLIRQIISELRLLSNDVVTNLVPVMEDPYPHLKFRQNPALETKTKEQLEEGIKASRLPDEIKDVIKEKHDDNTRPYFQMISTVLEQYKVQNLMSLTRSASRALRNGQHISEENRTKLYKTIQISWVAILKVLQLLTPILAKTGYGKLGGACFRLAGDFPEDENKRAIAVLASLPINIIEWFRNDVYSEKRYSIYKSIINNNDAPTICRHMNILLLVRCRPEGWHEVVGKYIETVGKNSFYISDVNNMLNYCYQVDEMSPKDERRTAKLILDSIDKMRKHYNDYNKDRYFITSKQKNQDILPKREKPY